MKKENIKIIISAILLIVGLLAKFDNQLIKNSIFIISYIIIGAEIIIKAVKNIFHGELFDENFLMAIATIGAIIIGDYPEAVTVMLFYEIGEMFQDRAIENSRKSIESLASIKADYANLKSEDGIKKVNPQDVKIGDLIVIKPGEKIPLDGKIVEGISTLDTSALTGESIPRGVETGDTILSGCININGVLTVEVVKEFGESTVSKILSLIEESDDKKSNSEKFITKFAKYYTPIVVVLALIIAIVPPIISHSSFVEWINRAFTFLVISCPCALVISIPLGFFGGIGAASKKGVLIKGSTYIEDLANSEIVVFDKTGTLTKGVFEVSKVSSTVDNITNQEILELAAYAENHSNHPIAKSILNAYGKEINHKLIEKIEEISGCGIVAMIKQVNIKNNTTQDNFFAGNYRETNEVIIGNSKIMEKFNIEYSKINEIGTVIYIAINKKYCGYIVISDVIKPDSKMTIEKLKQNRIKQTIMLTGDLDNVASDIAKELNIDKYYAELLPDEKVEKMKDLDKIKSKKGKLIFVGDGINDAPVLNLADIGIAMGGIGSDAAIEAADVVIMNDEPSKIIDAIKISKRTLKIVKQNIIFAIAVKIIVLLLGSLGIANMWEAVFADVGVSVIAVLNSLRILKCK
nr:heavy metal translocating P-type ATPase [Clostridia bacterium]